MGFFRKFFSLGSRKSKKKQRAALQSTVKVDAEGRIVRRDDDDQQTDAEVNRLLRSASARFAVVSEVDYTTLPPLPHPVNTLSVTPSLNSAPSTTSLQRSGTYVVKVHERQLISKTEFPHANPPLSARDDPRTPECNRDGGYYSSQRPLKEVVFTPRDQSRILTLRRDPSVASLLNLYDDQGFLNENAFSNSPPAPQEQEGHEQRKRTGSTLRQLLGEPEDGLVRDSSATEGDISWAERFLQERLDAASPLSSTSSLALETPTDALFPNDHSDRHHSLFSALEHELSSNYPVISSMEVELSGASDALNSDAKFEDPAAISRNPSLAIDTKTPQRASEIFGFLTERRRSLRERAQSVPPLSMSALNTDQCPAPSSPAQSLLPPTPDTASSSPVSFDDAQSHISHAQIRTATLTKFTTAPAILNPYSASMPFLPTTNAYGPSSSSRRIEDMPERVSTETTETVRAPRSSTSAACSEDPKIIPASRIPRGPRPAPPPKHDFVASQPDLLSDGRPLSRATRSSSRSTTSRASAQAQERPSEHEFLTVIPQRQARRSLSRTSAAPVLAGHSHTASEPDKAPRAASARRPSWRAGDKENGGELPLAPARHSKTAPSTPVRARSVFDVRYPGYNYARGGEGPPSPASSSELSPVAQDMMTSLRTQRLRAREHERRDARWAPELLP